MYIEAKFFYVAGIIAWIFPSYFICNIVGDLFSVPGCSYKTLESCILLVGCVAFVFLALGVAVIVEIQREKGPH